MNRTQEENKGLHLPVLEAHNVWRVFQTGPEKLEVLRGVNLEVKRGDFVAILGPSGSGKSTLLHILGGLDRPTQGRVLLDSLDLSSCSPSKLPELRNKKIGFVFQFHHLLAEFTVLENVALPLFIAGVGQKAAYSQAREVLTELGFTARMNHRPDQLSGGEKARTAVARALVSRPAVILADEPTGNLDVTSAEILVNLFVHLNETKGVTLVVVTHNEAVAARASRRLRLDHGILKTV